MDWPRPQPESSYLWDQVPQLRCYLYDPTSSHISTSLSRSLASRSLSSRFSFSPSLSFSFSLSLPAAALSLSLSCSFPSFLLSSCSLLCFFVSFPLGSPLPFLHIAAARVISSRSLLSLLLASRSFCFFQSYLPARRCSLSNARSSYVYIRETAIADLCHYVLSIARPIARR